MNNLFLNETTWPKELNIVDAAPRIGNPLFTHEGGLKISDYIPQNVTLTQHNGVKIPKLPETHFKLLFDLKLAALPLSGGIYSGISSKNKRFKPC